MDNAAGPQSRKRRPTTSISNINVGSRKTTRNATGIGARVTGVRRPPRNENAENNNNENNNNENNNNENGMGLEVGVAAPVAPAVQNINLPTPQLLDFWKTLWHVDVYKDHGSDYNGTIINNFLPDPTYHTTQSINGKNITIDGAPASRTPGGGTVVQFSDLFQYLTGQDFTELCSKEEGQSLSTTLKQELVGPNVVYDIKVFNELGSGMATFVEGNVAMYIDTASHIPEMLDNFRAQSGGRNLIYAYTREIQSDPADKMTFLTIGPSNRGNFYYEKSAPANPTVVPYMAYTPAEGLSYFYCKYPLFLRNNGPSDPPGTKPNKMKYKLDVELSYSHDGNMVVVAEGANIAGGARRATNALLKIKGISQADLIKEMVFIAKHHGDVAQSLVKFRDVDLLQPSALNELKTFNTKGAFVSIDCNAIIKALTIQMPYIFMYPPDKKKIIVWKNQSLSTPIERYASQRTYTMGQIDQVRAQIAAYNARIAEINASKTTFDGVISAKLVAAEPAGAAAVERGFPQVVTDYKELIQVAFGYAILSRYVPVEPIEAVADLGALLGEYPDPAAFAAAAGNVTALIMSKLDGLKAIQVELSRKSAELVVPENYGNLEMFVEGSKPRVKVEKEAVIGFAKARVEGQYNFKKGDNRVSDMWAFIDLGYNVGEQRESPRGDTQVRLGSKLNTAWGIDLVQFAYSELKKYNADLAKAFLINLYSIVNSIKVENEAQAAEKQKKLNTFMFGLSLVGITPAELGIAGGGERRQTRKKRGGNGALMVENSVAPSFGPRMGARPIVRPKLSPEMVTISKEYTAYLTQELTDIENHLELMMYLAHLENNSANMDINRFKKIGLIALDNYFANQYGPNYMVDEKFRSSWIAQINELMKISSGGGLYMKGGVNPIFTQFIIYLVNNPGVPIANASPNEAAPAAVDPEDLKILEISGDAKYYSSYSVMKYYKDIADDYEQALVNRFAIYYKLRTGLGGYGRMRQEDRAILEQKIQSVRNLIAQLESLDINPWLQPEPYIHAGGRRKTQKKRRSRMVKTMKRFKKLLTSGGR